MVVAYNTYDGISDQVFCNSAPSEVWALEFWANLFLFTPLNYEFDGAWHLRWVLNGAGGAVRREAFENAYLFEHGQRFNLLTGQLEDVTIIGADAYFAWLSDFLYVGVASCSSLLYPTW